MEWQGNVMEELRSTEILDKEIQADARKKAESILAKANVEKKNIADSVATRVAEARKEKTSKYEEKLLAFAKDRDASIPLEKERFLVSFIQSSLDKATDEYLESLKESDKLTLVCSLIEKYSDAIKSKKFNAFVYGFDEKNVKKQLDKKLDIVSYTKTDFNKIIIENSCGITNKMGVILESDDKQIRIRLTLSEVVSQIQDKYRIELVDALFDGGLSK